MAVGPWLAPAQQQRYVLQFLDAVRDPRFESVPARFLRAREALGAQALYDGFASAIPESWAEYAAWRLARDLPACSVSPNYCSFTEPPRLRASALMQLLPKIPVPARDGYADAAFEDAQLVADFDPRALKLVAAAAAQAGYADRLLDLLVDTKVAWAKGRWVTAMAAHLTRAQAERSLSLSISARLALVASFGAADARRALRQAYQPTGEKPPADS